MTFYRRWERGPERHAGGRSPAGPGSKKEPDEKPEPSRGEVEEWLEAFLGESRGSVDDDEKTPDP
jgi:hypothetical protein